MSIFDISKIENIEATAQRTDILHFVDVTGEKGVEGDGVWCQAGTGVMSMTESPSAQTKERKFINEKSKRKNITSYSPSFSFEALLMFNHPVIRKIYNIYTQRKTGAATVLSMITVDCFEEPVNGAYPARKGKYAVEVSSCDDDDDMIIKGNFNGQGDELMGYFNVATGEWTTDAPAEPASYSAKKAKISE